MARNYYKTTAVVKYWTGGAGKDADGLPSVSLNRNLFESILRDLLIEQSEYTVEVFEASGSSWKKTKCPPPPYFLFPQPSTCLLKGSEAPALP